MTGAHPISTGQPVQGLADNGATAVGGADLGVIDPSWSIAATGDCDENSSAAIRWRNINGATAIWQMQGSTVIGGGLNGSVATDWHIVA